MKRKITFWLTLIAVLTLSIACAGSAFAATDFKTAENDVGIFYEVISLPDVMYLTDEPITFTEYETRSSYDGETEVQELSYYEEEPVSTGDAIEITTTKETDSLGNERITSITLAPKKAGVVQIRFGSTALDYYKTIFVIDPEMSTKKRDTPTALEVNKYTPKTLSVAWDPVYGATEYRVYRSKTGEDGTFKKIKTTKKTAITDKDLTSGKTYYYKVKAVTKDGVSNYSKMKKCRVARKLNIEIDMRDKAGKATRFANVQVTNYGKNTFKMLQDVDYVAGREFINGGLYYPYEDASYSNAVMVNKDGKPLTSYSFKKNTTAVVNFRLDMERIPQKDEHITFCASYDGVYYTIMAGDGYVFYSYGFPGCGVKYTSDKVYQL